MTLALDHTVFDAVVRGVHDAAAQLERTRSEAARRVDALLGSAWTGVAAEAFAGAWADWAAAAGDVRAGLADIAELLDATHMDLTTRDGDSETTLTGLATRLHDPARLMREDVYAVDSDELASLVDDLARCHVALADLATDLDRRITDLHHSWSGSAADAHAIAQTTWADGFAGMREALARVQHAADVAHRNYTSAASANLQMWAELG